MYSNTIEQHRNSGTGYRTHDTRWLYMAPDRTTMNHMRSNIASNGTSSKLAIIDEVRRQLERRDPAGMSDNAFSQQYLDRSRSYISVIKHMRLDISDAALLALYRNLNGMSSTWRDIAETSPLSATRALQNHFFYKELAELVFGALMTTSH